MNQEFDDSQKADLNAELLAELEESVNKEQIIIDQEEELKALKAQKKMNKKEL